jgi:hypothetical protein
MDKSSPEDEHRREERAEALLIVCSAFLMLCGLAFLIVAALMARQERLDRAAPKNKTSIERLDRTASPEPRSWHYCGMRESGLRIGWRSATDRYCKGGPNRAQSFG